MDFAQKSVQAKQTFMFPVEVGGEEMNVFGKLLKQRPRHLATEHSNLQIRVLHSQVVDNWNRHGDVAQSRKPYD